MVNIGEGDVWRPFTLLGFTHSFFDINIETVTHTWVVLIILFLLVLPIKGLLRNRYGATYISLSLFINSFKDLVTETLSIFNFNHFCFITSLFCFILLCNIISVIPFMEEPTKDPNTTICLALISFVYVQFHAIRAHGLWGYIKEFFNPFFIMLPLNIIEKLATVVSMSFRLFGNIFGGSIISHIYFGALKSISTYTTAVLIELMCSGVSLAIVLFFGLFEGFLQAFVFAMLSLTYLGLELQKES